MMIFRSSAPRPTMTCFRRSCVRGRDDFTPASSIAIALASAGPIQIGSTRSPSDSRRITTGVLLVRSRPRLATRTSFIWVGSSPHIPRGKILLLLRRERVDPDTHARELEAGDVLVQVAGDAMDVLPQLLELLDDVLRRQGLVREGHIHHARGVTFRRREVHQPAVCQHEDLLATERPTLD